MNERRVFLVLVLLVVSQLVLLTGQVPSRRGQGSALDVLVLQTLAPPARLVTGAIDLVTQWRATWRGMQELRQENEALRQQLAELEAERLRAIGLELELENLARALDYTPPLGAEVRPADVVYIDHASWLRTLVLYLPNAALVRRGTPVTSVNGLVGRILEKRGAYARVQLVTDRASSVGAMVERTRRQGIVRGADGGLLSLDYVSLLADVRPGDRVQTAGIDGVYPAGIPIGTVTAVEPGDELFHRIRVLPSVDFGRLDQVYVLIRDGVPDELREAPSSASP